MLINPKVDIHILTNFKTFENKITYFVRSRSYFSWLKLAMKIDTLPNKIIY